jgi:2C-methyl-D-erythritol 2,4-cyclodiphosphate synthase
MTKVVANDVSEPSTTQIKDLLASKIAQLQVGDKSLDVDMSGLFSDEKLVESSVKAWEESLASGDVLRMETTVGGLLSHLAALYKKVGELNSKYIVMREQKAVQNDAYQSVSTTKSKLENLCRELQKQNKTIITESRRMAEEEDAKRKNLSQQFQTTIEEVTVKMDQQSKDYMASLQENETLQGKLKTFLAQYDVREQHFAHQMQAKDIAIKLAETKLEHQTELTTRETEKVRVLISLFIQS